MTILSRKQRSEMFGAMFLHEPIPGISPEKPEMTIQVTKNGTRWGYAESVYGDASAEVSWDKFSTGPMHGWHLREAYARLWELYSHLIVETRVTPESVAGIQADYIFTTIPATATCLNWAHSFDSVNIVVIHGPSANEENVMWYNGSEALGMPQWYRYSRINRYESWEFSEARAPKQIPTDVLARGLRVSKGIKPLRTTCNCHPGVIRLGRFGKWDKHAFTHHAYKEVIDALQ